MSRGMSGVQCGVWVGCGGMRGKLQGAWCYSRGMNGVGCKLQGAWCSMVEYYMLWVQYIIWGTGPPIQS